MNVTIKEIIQEMVEPKKKIVSKLTVTDDCNDPVLNHFNKELKQSYLDKDLDLEEIQRLKNIIMKRSTKRSSVQSESNSESKD